MKTHLLGGFVLALVPLALLRGGATDPVPGAGFDDGFASITTADLKRHLTELAGPELEGRDTPSAGLFAAGDYIIARMEEAGLVGAGPEGTFRMPFTRSFSVPDEKKTRLEVATDDAASAAEPLVLGEDFVSLPGCTGKAEGPVIFAGFGITDSNEKYDDLRGLKLKGTVAVVLEGEPRHRRMFDGPEVTSDADVYRKVEKLRKEDVAGVLVVRRPPAEESKGWDGKPLAPAPLGYRHTFADWNGSTTKPMPRRRGKLDTPVMEITPALASRLLGEDVLELATKIDKGGRPLKRTATETRVTMETAFTDRGVAAHNVVGLLAGGDPELAGEYVVLGAHYDHIGVDTWGRIGYGADDNGSGTGALLEVAAAMAQSGPRRSILFCAFAGEEDGLLGSEAFVDHPPVPLASMVAMLNMDMIGRGDKDEVVVLGTEPNPELGKLLKRAAKLKSTKLKRIITDKADHLWQRSDHYPFHKKGIPALFVFEAVSENDNPDYHTFRDTIDLLDLEKIARSARLTYNAAWILATDDQRPPAPRVR